MNPLLRSSFGLLALALGSFAMAAEPAVVKLTQTADRITVELGGKPFTEYRFAAPSAAVAATAEKSLPWARPYFYPVKAADGVEITSDQSLFNPKEHPHHRSLWVAQGTVNGVDHWAHAKAGATQPEQRHVKFEKVGGDTIAEELIWDGADGKPMLAEQRTWKFFAWPDGTRGIDLTSTYTAVAGTVTFGDTKEAGLCSIRLNDAISKTSTITQAGGVVSRNVKEEKNVWGKKADWCDLSGKIDGKDYGAAILDHPSNPRHPGNWHVRHYGLLAANIFGLHDFDPKGVEKGAGDFKIEPKQPVTFKYRVVIHTGDADAAKLKEKYADFAAMH